MNISKERKCIVSLYAKGYRVIDGVVYNPKKKIVKGSLTLQSGNYYHRFHSPTIKVHSFVAYQKFGDKWLYSDLIVRHLDGNSLNNLEYNIELGTYYDNAHDMSVE